MKVSLKKDDIGLMLERLGQAVSTGDMKGVSDCYAFPALLMIGENSTVLENAEQFEEMFSKGRDWYISQGILTTRPEIINIEEMTDLIAAVNVRWPGFDKDGRETHSETSHYILQSSENGPLIRVALSRTK
jgi:hypothetical protein